MKIKIMLLAMMVVLVSGCIQIPASLQGGTSPEIKATCDGIKCYGSAHVQCADLVRGSSRIILIAQDAVHPGDKEIKNKYITSYTITGCNAVYGKPSIGVQQYLCNCHYNAVGGQDCEYCYQKVNEVNFPVSSYTSGGYDYHDTVTATVYFSDTEPVVTTTTTTVVNYYSPTTTLPGNYMTTTTVYNQPGQEKSWWDQFLDLLRSWLLS